jgi:DNA polymerase-3 subunit alpha
VLFSEGLAQYRDVLEPGAAVLLQLGAELQGEDVAPGAACRSRWMTPRPRLKACSFAVRDTKPLDSIARRLNMPEAAASGGPAKGLPAKPAPALLGGADGDVSLVIMLDLQTEV